MDREKGERGREREGERGRKGRREEERGRERWGERREREMERGGEKGMTKQNEASDLSRRVQCPSCLTSPAQLILL